MFRTQCIFRSLQIAAISHSLPLALPFAPGYGLKTVTRNENKPLVYVSRTSAIAFHAKGFNSDNLQLSAVTSRDVFSLTTMINLTLSTFLLFDIA